ncbi:hypothetical protein TL16_g05272 [Triparma laevis f. inornata]|uniref:Isomerase YbhE n=1 Tax=Triparma laevis f. inornata TaxID=1714386 RepID=A0A9W7ALE0_9STRA|nr:hypothetical protein TL16_g05272 [Triparma laevis f. inornata]
MFTVTYDESGAFGDLKRLDGDFGNPGWMVFSGDGSLIVGDESAPGRILTLDPTTFQPIKDPVVVGDHPCHVIAHEHLVISSSYTGGTVNITNTKTNTTTIIDHSAIYAEVWSKFKPSTTDHQDRQESSHPHQCIMIKGTTFLLVSDLGSSTITTYDIAPLLSTSVSFSSSAPINLTPLSTLIPSTGPTSGCRHSLFLGTEDVYTVNELNDTITHSKLSLSSGELTEVSTINLLAEDLITRGHHGGAGGICSNNANDLIYVTVRHTSPGGVVTFKRDESRGVLERVSVTESGGDVPRFIGNIKSDIFICNQAGGGKVVKLGLGEGESGAELNVGAMVTWIGEFKE